MSDYISRAALHDLTGTPQRARQITWLTQNRWLFSIDVHGYPKVAQAYFDRRMVGVESAAPKGDAEPNWAAMGI